MINQFELISANWLRQIIKKISVILQKDHFFLFIRNIKQLVSEKVCIFEFVSNDIISNI